MYTERDKFGLQRGKMETSAFRSRVTRVEERTELLP